VTLWTCYGTLKVVVLLLLLLIMPFTILLDMIVVSTQVNIMSNINEPFVNDGGRFEVVFMSLSSSRYQLRLSILGLFVWLHF